MSRIENLMEFYLKEIELIYKQNYGVFTESAIAEDMLNKMEFPQDKSSNTIPSIIPFFSPEEILDYTGNYTDFVDDYLKACSTGLVGYNYLENYHKVQELYKEYQENKTPELENAIISLGWNPSVEPNEYNLKIARDRISRYIDKNYSVNIIDISNMIVKEDISSMAPNSALEPIFIVLSFTHTLAGRFFSTIQGSKYSHGSISFDSTMNNIFAFDAPGLVRESLKKYLGQYDKARIKVLCLFVTKFQKNKIRYTIDYFIGNNTKYSILELVKYVGKLGTKDLYSLKMFCTEFVDSLLRICNINITGTKYANFVSPRHYETLDNPNVYTIYEGLVKNYNQKEVDKKVNALLYDPKVRKQIELRESLDVLKNKDILLYKMISINNEAANNSLNKMIDLLTVSESAFIESKKFPIRVTDTEVEIDYPESIEQEYQKAHKLLLDYEKAKNYNGIKYELARLWYLNNMTERKMKGVFTKNKKEIKDTRARILNDFNKYLNMILNNEPNFNFTLYFNNSPYYDRSISIDKSTIKWSGKLIKDVIRPF